MAYDKDDFIWRDRKNSTKRDKLYRCTCCTCGGDRGYFAKNLANLDCKACQMAKYSDRMKGKIPKAATEASVRVRIGKPRSAETKAKIAQVHKGKKHSLEHRIINSCNKQGISREAFDGFIYEKDDNRRYKYYHGKFSLQVLKMANFTCDRCKHIGGVLHGHHMNNWKQYPDERYDYNNIVCLCYKCHREFHTLYGSINNTKIQYSEFKNNNNKDSMYGE